MDRTHFSIVIIWEISVLTTSLLRSHELNVWFCWLDDRVNIFSNNQHDYYIISNCMWQWHTFSNFIIICIFSLEALIAEVWVKSCLLKSLRLNSQTYTFWIVSTVSPMPICSSLLVYAFQIIFPMQEVINVKVYEKWISREKMILIQNRKLFLSPDRDFLPSKENDVNHKAKNEERQ